MEIYSRSEFINQIYTYIEIFGDGPQITAAVIEYNKIILRDNIGCNFFRAEDRKITSVTVAEDKDLKPAQKGRYVKICFETPDPVKRISLEESYHSGLGFRGSKKYVKMDPVLIQQVKDIVAADGAVLSASDKIVSLKRIVPIADDFIRRRFYYREEEKHTSEYLDYNLYLPEDFDIHQTYPLIIFLEDAGKLSDEAELALYQGSGGMIWASKEEQAKHPSIVVAPQYRGTAPTVDDDFNCTWEVDATIRLLCELAERYPVDKTRIYGTGQSMGCMMLCEMNAREPELFAGCLLVAGQWDPQRMVRAKHNNFWIVVSEYDRKAFPGMNAVVEAFEAAGEIVAKGIIDSAGSLEQMEQEVLQVRQEGRHINYTYITGEALIPKGVNARPGAFHENTWRLVYQIEALRDWLFEQKR